MSNTTKLIATGLLALTILPALAALLCGGPPSLGVRSVQREREAERRIER